jgi:transposase
MESGPRVVFRYSSTHEKEIPHGSFRRRMELLRTPPSRPQRFRTPQVSGSSRDPKRHLLPPEERLPVALASPRLPQVAHRLPLLQNLAHRWYLGEGQPGHPRTTQDTPEARPPSQRGRSGLSVGEDYCGARRRAGLRRRQEGEGQSKRHILVDTEGLVLKVKLHSANVLDQMGIKTLLRQADGQFPRLSHLWLDAGYRGEDKGADWVRKTLGWSVQLVERPKKPVPEEVLMKWAAEWAKEGVAVDWRKLLPPKGYLELPRRWVVERTIAWIDHNRRMSKDYERSCASGEALVYACMIRLMMRRLARV